MRKKTAFELGAIVIMAVVLFFGVTSLFPKKKNEPVRAMPIPGAQGPVAALPKRSLFLSPVIKIKPMKDDKFYVKFCRIADALPLSRDPFSYTGAGPKTSRDDLELTGILWDPKRPTAVINGVFYSVGNSTDQFTVTGIQEDKVLLKDGTGDFELRLKS